MAFKQKNPNPYKNTVGDCVVRAVSIAMGKDWVDTYLDLCTKGLAMGDMPSSDKVWIGYLKDKGFKMNTLPDKCPECYTIADFADEHKKGTFVLGTGAHAVAVIDGDHYDTWDSGEEVPIFYLSKEIKA